MQRDAGVFRHVSQVLDCTSVDMDLPIEEAAMAPTQLLLIIPYVRMGEWIARAPIEPLSIQAGMAVISQGIGRAVIVLWSAILHAGLAWTLTTPILVFLH